EALPGGPQGAQPSARAKPADRDHSGKRERSYKEKSWQDRPPEDHTFRRDDRPRQDGGPQDQKPRREQKPHLEDRSRDAIRPRREGKPKFEGPSRGSAALRDPNQRFDRKGDKPSYVAKAKRDGAASFAKPAFGKKPKKNKKRG